MPKIERERERERAWLLKFIIIWEKMISHPVIFFSKKKKKSFDNDFSRKQSLLNLVNKSKVTTQLEKKAYNFPSNFHNLIRNKIFCF